MIVVILKIAPKFEGSVESLLSTKIREAYSNAQFQADVMKPMKVFSVRIYNTIFCSD